MVRGRTAAILSVERASELRVSGRMGWWAFRGARERAQSGREYVIVGSQRSEPASARAQDQRRKDRMVGIQRSELKISGGRKRKRER